jgi:hypothetical protein
MSKITIPSEYRYSLWVNLIESHQGHWFDKDTINFFGSRILWGSLTLVAGRPWLFITSEHNWDRTQRLYSVRSITNDGEVDTVGEFQNFETLREAKRFLEQHAQTSVLH